MPFSAFCNEIRLLRSVGVDISETYNNDKQASNFISFIAEEIKEEMKTSLEKSLGTFRNLAPNPINQRKEMIKDLYDKAETAIDLFDYQSAVECYKKILNIEPENIETMEMLAGIYTDLGSIDDAKTLYLRCIEIAPKDDYKNYFNLAQMSEGEEALIFYQKGISLLEKKLEEIENTQPEENSCPENLTMTLSDSYCAIAELYMTDLCDDENAYELCKAAIDKCISVEPKNPDSYRIQTSFYLVEGNVEDAKISIQKNLSLWFDKYENMRDKPEENIEIISVPSYMTRIEISKSLIELEMFEEANKILEGLIEENDEVFIAWYLLGWLNYSQGDVYFGNAYHYFKKGKQVAKKTGEDDSDQARHIDELFVILTEKGVQSEEEEEDEDNSDQHSSSSDDECMDT